MPETYCNYINGKWVASLSGETVSSTNPANSAEIMGLFQKSSREDVDSAVVAASAALPAWRETPAPERGQFLLKAANILERRLSEIAEVLCREEGKTFKESKGETLRGVHLLQFYSGETWRITGETFPSLNANRLLYTLRVPLGVVAAITPWNFPIAIPVWKIAPALAYGNTVVFKPAGYSPLCGVMLMQVFEEAGLPAGVLNLVTGSGAVLGEPLVKNPAIRGVSFTGSCAVGRKIAVWGAEQGIKVQLEMGGKNAVIVLADADIDKAAEIVVQGSMLSAGQKCTSTSRALVHRDVRASFTETVVKKVNALRVGDPMDENTAVGPMVSETQLENVLEYVNVGREEGAELLCGGHRLAGADLDNGYFMAPTVFGKVTPQMRIAQEEIFGPLVAIISVDSFEEAIAVANASRYGLSASICTRDIGSVLEYVRRIEVGLVHVNNQTAGAEPHVPFGGFKDSTSGYRDMGRTAIEFYTRYKTVYLDGA